MYGTIPPMAMSTVVTDDYHILLSLRIPRVEVGIAMEACVHTNLINAIGDLVLTELSNQNFCSQYVFVPRFVSEAGPVVVDATLFHRILDAILALSTKYSSRLTLHVNTAADATASQVVVMDLGERSGLSTQVVIVCEQMEISVTTHSEVVAEIITIARNDGEHVEFELCHTAVLSPQTKLAIQEAFSNKLNPDMIDKLITQYLGVGIQQGLLAESYTVCDPIGRYGYLHQMAQIGQCSKLLVSECHQQMNTIMEGWEFNRIDTIPNEPEYWAIHRRAVEDTWIG
jgi:hypothetical protein